MKIDEAWAVVAGILMIIAFGAFGHWCASSMEDSEYKKPFFEAIEGEDIKTNKLFQVPSDCMLKKPTAAKSTSEKNTVIFTYAKTCKEGDAVATEYLFAVCNQYYPYGQNEYERIQCQISGWIKLH